VLGAATELSTRRLARHPINHGAMHGGVEWRSLKRMMPPIVPDHRSDLRKGEPQSMAYRGRRALAHARLRRQPQIGLSCARSGCARWHLLD
jgi:hypothetical protein